MGRGWVLEPNFLPQFIERLLSLRTAAACSKYCGHSLLRNPNGGQASLRQIAKARPALPAYWSVNTGGQRNRSATPYAFKDVNCGALFPLAKHYEKATEIVAPEKSQMVVP